MSESVENQKEKPENAKFDEIEQSSLFMSLFSRIDENSGNFINQPAILGGNGYFSDEHAKESVEHAFGQLNLPDLFQQFDFVLNVAFYMPVKLKEDLKISPNFWMVKSKYEGIFAMYLILSPYSDLNITALNKDLVELVVDYSGTAIRTGMKKSDKKSGMLDLAIDPDLQEASDLLLQRIYYRLFLDRSLSGGPEKPTKAANLVAIMIQEATINRGWIDLDTNRLYTTKDKESFEDPDKLRPSPPILTVDDCWFLFPQSLREEHKDYHAPINLRYLFEASHLPSALNMAYFRLNPDLFQEILPLPAKSIFTYRDSDDVISLFSHHREIQSSDSSKFQDALKIQIVTGISDSKMVGEDFFSEMAMRIIIRDIEDGFKKKQSLEKIFTKNMQLKSWFQSKTYSVTGETTPEGLLGWDKIEEREKL